MKIDIPLLVLCQMHSSFFCSSVNDVHCALIVASSGVFRISKRGAKCSLDTSAHTKGGAKPSFTIFLLCQKKKFLAKGGPWPNGPS